MPSIVLFLLAIHMSLGACFAAAAPASDTRKPAGPENTPHESATAPGAKPPKIERPRSTPGIYPVYHIGRHWLLLDRSKGRGRSLEKNSSVLVIGSKGAGIFRAAVATLPMKAACENGRAFPTSGFNLAANRKTLQRVGTPIMAILIKPGRSVDPSKATFRALENEVKESNYSALDQAIRSAIMVELQAGIFPVREDDARGKQFARNPKAEGIQMKIEFGAKVPMRATPDAFVTVDGAEISQTYRRCLRLLSGDKPLGSCAPMAHSLMAETRALHFVTYDPDSHGRPFLLAYTEEEPLWGHERWGFQMTSDGPKIFLKDAMDPRCREGF